MELHPASADDTDRLFRIHENLFRDAIERIWGWDESSQRENFSRELREFRIDLIHENGDFAGFLQTREEDDHIYLPNLAILPSHQGKGIGTAVIRHLQEQASGKGKDLKLNVFRCNARALSLYLRLGFITDGETESGVRLRWEHRRRSG